MGFAMVLISGLISLSVLSPLWHRSEIDIGHTLACRFHPLLGNGLIPDLLLGQTLAQLLFFSFQFGAQGHDLGLGDLALALQVALPPLDLLPARGHFRLFARLLS